MWQPVRAVASESPNPRVALQRSRGGDHRDARESAWPESSVDKRARQCTAALSKPNRIRTVRFTSARNRQHRTAVAAACGNVTSATAVVVPNSMASNGVIKLPMPNPTTVAVAPESMATMKTAAKTRGLSRPVTTPMALKRG
jgi:hypothetical protein